MSIGLMTELEAVNRILAASGDSPVITLGDGYLQSDLAYQELKQTSRDLQGSGWYFNEEQSVTLTPDLNNSNIILPANCIEAIVEHYNGGKVIQRGNKLYDRENRTYEFTDVVKADLLLNLDWDELPQVFREVATYQAALIFINNFVGDPNLLQVQQLHLQQAMVKLMNADSQSRNVSMLENPSSANIIFRNRQ